LKRGESFEQGSNFREEQLLNRESLQIR
jgi:hypothetical protein